MHLQIPENDHGLGTIPEKNDYETNMSVAEDLRNESSWQSEDSTELRYAGLVIEKQILDHAAFVSAVQFCETLTLESRTC